MFSDNSFDPFSKDMEFTSFNSFADDSFFDFNGASSDGALAEIEQSPKAPETFFDSAFGSDATTVSDVYSDMCVWPSDHSTQESESTQTEIPSSPPIPRVSEIITPGQGSSSSPIPISEPMGPREQLWRPMMSFDVPTPGSQPKARVQRQSNSLDAKNTASKPGPKAGNKPGPKPVARTKVTKVTKKKSTGAQKHPAVIPEPRQRSIQELYNAAWDSLSQDEKGRLLLPLLHGINPETGKKVAEASTMLPPPDFEAIGANHLTNHSLATSSPATTTTALSISSPSSNNTDNGYNAIGTDYFPPNMNMHPSFTSTCSFTSNDTSVDADFANMTASALQDFNSSYGYNHVGSANNSILSNSFGDFNGLDNLGTFRNSRTIDYSLPEVSHNLGRGLGGPCGNGIIGGNLIQIPASPSVYGCTRQQEALEHNAMLCAPGRHR